MKDTKNKIYKEIRKEGRKGEREEGRKKTERGLWEAKIFFSLYTPHFE